VIVSVCLCVCVCVCVCCVCVSASKVGQKEKKEKREEQNKKGKKKNIKEIGNAEHIKRQYGMQNTSKGKINGNAEHIKRQKTGDGSRVGRGGGGGEDGVGGGGNEEEEGGSGGGSIFIGALPLVSLCVFCGRRRERKEQIMKGWMGSEGGGERERDIEGEDPGAGVVGNNYAHERVHTQTHTLSLLSLPRIHTQSLSLARSIAGTIARSLACPGLYPYLYASTSVFNPKT
jgi:hypothetical protein